MDQKWQNDTPSVKDQFQYGYDRNSNRLWRDNVVASSAAKKLDEVYHDNDYDDAYDGLDRLKWFRRGTITDSGGEKHITDGPNLAQEQNFTLDAVGNWPEFKDDADGVDSWDLDQNRAHNEANEIEGNSGNPIWPEAGGEGWEDPVYDAAGNQTFGPKPGAETTDAEAQHYIYPVCGHRDLLPVDNRHHNADRMRSRHAWNASRRAEKRPADLTSWRSCAILWQNPGERGCAPLSPISFCEGAGSKGVL